MVMACSGTSGVTFEPTYEEKPWLYDPRSETGRKRIERMKELLREVLPRLGGKALDVGCGMGISTFALEELGFDVTGIDTQKELVEKAREIALELGYKAESRVMDARNLDFPYETFDLVTFLGSPLPNMSVYDFDSAVGEAFHVMKPGVLVIEYADWVRSLHENYREVLVEEPFTSFHVRFDTLTGTVERLFVNFEKGYFFRTRINIWAPWIVEFVLRKAGLDVKTHYRGCSAS